MRLVWDIEYDYDEAYVIGVREGLRDWIQARLWTIKHRLQRRAPKQWPPTNSHGIVDMSNAIYMLDVDTSAFETMMMRPMYKWPVQTVTWLEDELMPRIASVGLWGEWDWIEPSPVTVIHDPYHQILRGITG